MEKSNQGGSNRDNTTSKQSGDEQRSSHSEKGKDDMSKGKKNNQREGSDRSRSASGDKK